MLQPLGLGHNPQIDADFAFHRRAPSSRGRPAAGCARSWPGSAGASGTCG
jgi:hypothetical protein